MSIPSIRFKKMFLALSPADRATVLNSLSMWTSGLQCDPKINQFTNFLAQLNGLVFSPKKDLEKHWVWALTASLNDCITFQEVVKSKLGVPTKNIALLFEKKDKPVRKTIPKKTREAVWKKDCGDSTSGKCYCCLGEVTALGTWHAGHIIAQSNGGPDTTENLRVICIACNLAMGTENMNDFKKRCYPANV